MTFWYLATEYARHPAGPDEAFRMACRETARMIRAGVPVFSPIAHSHSVAEYGPLPETDLKFWLDVDAPMMLAAKGCIVFRSSTWQTSRGVAREIEYFTNADKPVVYLDPDPAEIPAALKQAAYEWSRHRWHANVGRVDK